MFCPYAHLQLSRCEQLRMLDATNGQVVYSKPVAEVAKGGISIAGFGELSAFMASPLGRAVQKMIDKAADDIITTSFPGVPSAIVVREPESGGDEET